MDKSSKQYLDYVESYGYVLAQLYQSYVKWVEKNRHHEAKVSMRSGYPIMHAAQWLGEHGLVKCDEWDEIWLNRRIMTLMSLGKVYKGYDEILEYIKQQGFDKPFTFVDNGYDGSITQSFEGCNINKEIQTLLMLGSDAFQQSAKKRAFIGHMKAVKTFGDKGFGPIVQLQDIIENMPQEYEEYIHTDFTSENNRINIEPRKKTGFELNAFAKFKDGMTTGFKDCFEAVKSDDRTQLTKYTNILVNKTPRLLLDAATEKECEHFDKIKEMVQEVYKNG